MKSFLPLLLLMLLTSGLQQASAQGCRAFFESSRRWFSVIDSATQFNNLTDKDSTLNTTYQWTIDGMLVSNSRDLSYTFPTIGTYSVCLTHTDSTTNCVNTFCRNIKASYQRSCFTSMDVNDTIDSCHAVFIPKYHHTRPIDSIVVDFGDGDRTTILSHKRVLREYKKSGNYRPIITTYAGAGKCRTESYSTVQISGCNGKMLCANWIGVRIEPDSASIRDSITYPDARYRLWHSSTYLIEKVGDTLRAIDTVQCSNCYGSSFDQLCTGNYYVKAALDSVDSFYNQFMPTYYGNVLRWDTVPSTLRLFGIRQSRYASINLIKGTNPGGPGFIAGNVTQGANKKEGDPLGGIQVMVLNGKSQPVAFTYSRNDGRFIFEDLPLGNLYVYAEVAGVKSLGNWITLTEDETEEKNVKIEVTNSYVATSLAPSTPLLANPIELYPNPTQNVVNVSVGNNSGLLTVSDLSGRALMQTNIHQNLLLNLDALESGAYILSFASESGTSFRKTLIKE